MNVHNIMVDVLADKNSVGISLKELTRSLSGKDMPVCVRFAQNRDALPGQKVINPTIVITADKDLVLAIDKNQKLLADNKQAILWMAATDEKPETNTIPVVTLSDFAQQNSVPTWEAFAALDKQKVFFV
jgi:hypothetical protein